MRTNFKLLLWALVLLTGCSMHNSDINQLDIDLIKSLSSEMEQSLDYNDSLFSAVTIGDDAMASYYNEMFHFHDSLYEAYHEAYSHRSTFEDHHHDSQGMHQSVMINNHSGRAGHHIAHHQTMDSLLINHEEVHPDH